MLQTIPAPLAEPRSPRPSGDSVGTRVPIWIGTWIEPMGVRTPHYEA